MRPRRRRRRSGGGAWVAPVDLLPPHSPVVVVDPVSGPPVHSWDPDQSAVPVPGPPSRLLTKKA